MIRKLVWWYVISAPLVIIRVGLTAASVGLGATLAEAVVIAWFIERPLYFWAAAYIDRRFDR
jgi:hypothetical protein